MACADPIGLISMDWTCPFNASGMPLKDRDWKTTSPSLFCGSFLGPHPFQSATTSLVLGCGRHACWACDWMQKTTKITAVWSGSLHHQLNVLLLELTPINCVAQLTPWHRFINSSEKLLSYSRYNRPTSETIRKRIRSNFTLRLSSSWNHFGTVAPRQFSTPEMRMWDMLWSPWFGELQEI